MTDLLPKRELKTVKQQKKLTRMERKANWMKKKQKGKQMIILNQTVTSLLHQYIDQKIIIVQEKGGDCLASYEAFISELGDW